MFGPYVHRIDPIWASVVGVHFWWYGLGFSLAFVELLILLLRHRSPLRLARSDVWALALMFAAGVLLGGRAVQVSFDEWPLYRANPQLVPAYWLGGMATHGLLIGGASAAALFALWYRKPFLELADALVIPGAFLLGLGRIGNFVDGQIVGSITTVPWAVQFPDAPGFRHPVVLYDGLKNLLLIPYLAWVRRTNPTPGAVAARFVFWYAFLRIFIDLFRDYPTHRLALGTGQTLNLVMAAIGVVLVIRSHLRRTGRIARRFATADVTPPDTPPSAVQRLAFAVIVGFCLLIPSNWTQDIPARYGARHPGLVHSAMYPALDTGGYRPTVRQ